MSERVGIIAQTSGLSIIQIESKKQGGKHKHKKKKKNKTVLIGGADYRRDGTVAGR